MCARESFILGRVGSVVNLEQGVSGYVELIVDWLSLSERSEVLVLFGLDVGNRVARSGVRLLGSL